MQTEHRRTQRNDDMKRQTGHTKQVVHVQPHALEIGTDAQVEEILHQRWQQHHDTRHQRQCVQQRHHTDDPLGPLQRKRQAALAVQIVDKVAAVVSFLDDVGFAHLAIALQLEPLFAFPRGQTQQRGLAVRIRQTQAETPFGFGMLSKKLLERFVNVGADVSIGCRRLRPLPDLGLQHRERARVESDEQQQPADDAHPTVHRQVVTQNVWPDLH